MSPAEIQVKINVMQKEIEFWHGVLRKRGCHDCRHWQHPGCGIADGETPPAEVQKSGCPEWNWDEIPF